jgi:hypothetical protein
MKPNNSYPKLPEIVRVKSRPKSFSEGYGVVNNFPIYDELPSYLDEDNRTRQHLDIIPELSIKEVPKLDEVIPKKDYIEIIYNKIVGFTFHLLLIATFELIFFNYYIIQYENNAVISLSNQLIGPIINSCSELSNNNKIIVNDFINLFVNETIIDNNAISDKNIREINNKDISRLSVIYYIGMVSVFIFILLINLILKRKIDFVMILFDNLIMISILGIYEYLFFNNIVFKYLTLGPNELIKNIMNNVLSAC